ncbi:HNH endonuclease [Succinivibrio faecicola]|uniref:HNH endonuclease n=1 Tax=Succinivibrio faecicola TaxID=2820300 RepID=A0ABS7DFM7_9GAMM|nr:HNH endonuclease signature motif containing protein [Succinivibrio faecicola]MBW7570090.1 HNH endonuclease [Succinivibrio faecicola]
MAGWALTEGEYSKISLSDSDLSRIFASIFSPSSRNTTSYKFGFIKSLLDNLYNVDSSLSLSFDTVFSTFAESYWNLILKYNLNQQSGKNAKITTILKGLFDSFGYGEVIPFESLSNEQKLQIIKAVKVECSKYVVGALYDDSSRSMYSFSKKTKVIQFNPTVYKYLCTNKVMLEKVNYFEWSRFLEKVNSEEYTKLISTKLDVSTQRSDLSMYRQILYEEFECHNCFYCGKSLKSKIHVDHFIPWSFVKEDRLYNFVLACPHCNTQKNNKLAPQKFIHDIVERNNVLINESLRIEDMYRIDTNSYTDSTINNLYEYALVNGFRRWDVSVFI